MLLKKILFQNYKTFYGPQQIDLTPPPFKEDEYVPNIALIGGLNGAGKTTILKAIWYALFGNKNMDAAAQKKWNASIINNYAFAEGSRQASLSLFIETGKEEWEIEINFYINENKIVTHEERFIFIRPLSGTYRKKHTFQNMNDFSKYTNSIIPSYAAPFFIFDGEEIKDLIKKQDTNQMISAIKTITGATAYDVLLNDLEDIITSINKELSKTTNINEVKNAEAEFSKLEEEFEREKRLLEIKQFEANKNEKALQQLKKERMAIISQNNHSRETIGKQIGRLENSIDTTSASINEMFKNQYSKILLSEKIDQLKVQVTIEKKYKEDLIMNEKALKPFNDFLNIAIKEGITPPLTPEQLKQIQEKGSSWYAKQFNISLKKEAPINIIHDLSGKDENYLISLQSSSINTLESKIKQLHGFEQELDQTIQKQSDAPETLNIDSENTRIDLLNQKQLALKNTINPLRIKVNSLQDKLLRAKKQFNSLTNKSTNGSNLSKELNNVEKTYTALSQHVRQLLAYKASAVKEEFDFMLRKLIRKTDEFSKIEFDLNTASIRLYNSKNQEIDIDSRSAGEQQMISSALIWALTRVSYLDLPIVIDTPLGRLDSKHRKNLIENYYRDLSSQVIILSTDTEVDASYLKEISQFTYNQYTLDYDENKKYTVIRDGYFNMEENHNGK